MHTTATNMETFRLRQTNLTFVGIVVDVLISIPFQVRARLHDHHVHHHHYMAIPYQMLRLLLCYMNLKSAQKQVPKAFGY